MSNRDRLPTSRAPTTGGVMLGSEYDVARTRKMNADAEIAEMELAQLRLKLCNTEDVVKAWADVLNACRAKFLSLPTKLAPVVATEDDASVVKQLLEDQIHEALSELSNYNPEIHPTQMSGNADLDEIEPEAEQPKKKRGRPKKANSDNE